MRPAKRAADTTDGHDNVDACERGRTHLELGFGEEDGGPADRCDGVAEKKPGAEEKDHVAEMACSERGFAQRAPGVADIFGPGPALFSRACERHPMIIRLALGSDVNTNSRVETG